MRVAVVYPELLGTYGDSGNGLVMVERARRRGLDAELVTVGIDDDMPDASIFLLGGGEDVLADARERGLDHEETPTRGTRDDSEVAVS